MEPLRSKNVCEEIAYRRGYSQAIDYVLRRISGNHPFIEDVRLWRVHGNKQLMEEPPVLTEKYIQQIRKLASEALAND
jgi:hypothetical protein